MKTYCNWITEEFEGLALGAIENTTIITDQTKHHKNCTSEEQGWLDGAQQLNCLIGGLSTGFLHMWHLSSGLIHSSQPLCPHWKVMFLFRSIQIGQSIWSSISWFIDNMIDHWRKNILVRTCIFASKTLSLSCSRALMSPCARAHLHHVTLLCFCSPVSFCSPPALCTSDTSSPSS